MSVQLIGSGTIGGIDEGLVISGIVTATELDISGDINVHNTTATSTTDPVTLDLGGQFTANASITQANLKLKLYHNGSNGDAQGITASASGLSYVSSHTTDHIFYTVPSSINSLVERLRINSSGFIGMGGNTNPTNVLHIKTAVTNTAVATIESTATNSYPFLRLKNDAREYQLTCHGGLSDAFTIYDGTSSAHRFTIASDGDVGIGTNSPVERLHVHKASATGPFMYITNTSTGVSASDGIQIGYDGTNTAVFKNNEPTDLVFYAGSQNFRITSSGHVLPDTNNTQDLGSSSKRWRNIYTTDLQLSNKGKTNDVDNTWGDYTIQEGENDLYLINNRNGKKYKFNLTEVS